MSAPGPPSVHDPYGPNRERGPIAGPGRRLAARVLDGLLIAVVIAVVFAVVERYGTSILTGLLLGLFISPLIAPLVVSPLLLRRGAHNGQTLGKQWLGIRVVRSDGGAVSGGTAASREMLGVFLLGLVPFYSLVDALMVPTAERGRSIHDRIADTLVVRVGAEAPHWTGRPAAGPVSYEPTPAEGAWSARPAPAVSGPAVWPGPPAKPAAPPRPVAAVPAGWYADPSDPGSQRWWDGAAWTEHVG
ncbi:RDD family protein [Patulibacter sp. NPDC049589]|uniref:RDD family protein n=1 Tax=Patulibacter sp. NPDC049589 TaxID=3154731 RepID=UPI00343189CC